jgi:phosphatidylglycerophosphate synthase
VTMSVTRVHVTEREQYLAQIDRLVHSQVLHGSESLCKLLRCLAEHALDHPGSALKEYQIATEIFGRPANFDPQSDSTIRVQVGRLRLKMAEYYTSEGADDPIQVEMPKGTYVLSFHRREGSAARLRAVSQSAQHEEIAAEAKAEGKWKVAFLVLLVTLIVASTAVAFWLEHNSRRADRPSESVPPAFATFWKNFVSGPEEPWVIFSNGAFVGRPETGMRYFDPARDPRDQILEHYTGVGEVLAIHALDHTFGLLRRQIRVKRGSLLSLDDVKNNDTIFVGSPAENLTLRDIPSTEDFIFRALDSGPRKGDLAIVNVHPQSGEAAYWVGSASHANLVEDYSVIALVRGLNPAKSVLFLAGTTTIGTQAAVEFVCQQNSLEEMLPRLQISDSGELKPFEAVLRVKVTRGVPVESEIVALRSGKP